MVLVETKDNKYIGDIDPDADLFGHIDQDPPIFNPRDPAQIGDPSLFTQGIFNASIFSFKFPEIIIQLSTDN